MCRLLGVRANRAVDLEFSLSVGPSPFQSLAERNADGWGMGWYEGHSPTIYKEAISALESPAFSSLSASAVSEIFICHVRKSTHGVVAERNSHPFQFGKWLFAHNGNVDRDSLWRLLEEKHRAAIEGETDSEVYFHWLLQNIETAKGDSIAGIRSALREVRRHSYTGLNFLLSDGGSLFAYREAAKNREYYSLYYLKRNPGQPDLDQFMSKEVGALINSKCLRGEKAVLVCSEKLTDEDWRRIPPGQLLVVTDGLKTRLEQIA